MLGPYGRTHEPARHLRDTAGLLNTAVERRLKHPTPYTLHPSTSTQHPTPYTLHPAPYTLHPIPFDLRYP
jgi:hypothetical protein